jgi:uncharacterized protein YndB with AHSA1/START domain
MGETSFQPNPAKNRTTTERRGDRDLVMTRTFAAPPRIVFEAWTKPELFMLWWPPKSSGVPMVGCDMDVRVGGGYSVTFQMDGADAMTFFGKYTEVDPPARLVWTNEEGGEISITTVTFEEKDGQTLLVMSERYPSKEALDASYVGMECGTPEQFEQLDDLLVTLSQGV